MPVVHSRLQPPAGDVRTSPPWKLSGFRSPVYSHDISFPFAGIGGPDRALKEGGWPAVGKNIVELRKECRLRLNQVHGKAVAKTINICNLMPEDWDDSQGLFSGPPCIDFSSMGKCAGYDGKHGTLFERLLAVIRDLATRAAQQKLRYVVLENVYAITFNRKKSGNAFLRIRGWWAEHMPDWTPFRLYRMDARDTGLAQRRDRVFLVSFQRDFNEIVGGMPETLPQFPHQSLQDALLDVSADPKGDGLSDLQVDNVHK